MRTYKPCTKCGYTGGTVRNELNEEKNDIDDDRSTIECGRCGDVQCVTIRKFNKESSDD